MIRKFILYFPFTLSLLMSLALLAITTRSFWIADSYSWAGPSTLWPVGGIPQRPRPGFPPDPSAPPAQPSGYHIGSYHSLASIHGNLIWSANYEDPLGRRPAWQHELMVPSMFFLGLPIHVSHYFFFDYQTLVGRPSISSYIDPTGKSDILLARDIIVPEWLPILIFAGLSVVLFVPIWRRRRSLQRLKLGQCVNCGYDLRAHAAGEKCPECGRSLTDAKVSRSPPPR